jgi:hypothetical protein
VSGIREKAAQTHLLSVTVCNIRTKRRAGVKVDYLGVFVGICNTWYRRSVREDGANGPIWGEGKSVEDGC